METMLNSVFDLGLCRVPVGYAVISLTEKHNFMTLKFFPQIVRDSGENEKETPDKHI